MREQDNSASLQLANGPKLGPFAAGSVLYSLPHLCRLSSNFCRIGGSGKSKSDLNRSRDGRAEVGESEQGSGKSLLLFVPPLSPASGSGSAGASGREGGTNQADTFPDDEGGRQRVQQHIDLLNFTTGRRGRL